MRCVLIGNHLTHITAHLLHTVHLGSVFLTMQCLRLAKSLTRITIHLGELLCLGYA